MHRNLDTESERAEEVKKTQEKMDTVEKLACKRERERDTDTGLQRQKYKTRLKLVFVKLSLCFCVSQCQL